MRAMVCISYHGVAKSISLSDLPSPVSSGMVGISNTDKGMHENSHLAIHLLYLTCTALSGVGEGEVTNNTTDKDMHENSHLAIHVLI